MESQIFSYKLLKDTFFNTGKDVVFFKNPITWYEIKIIGIRKKNKMIGSIEFDGSSTYNVSRVEDSSYYKLYYEALMESI